MRLVIILLLVIIFILAPWTILVAIGAAAVYGTYLAIGGVLLAIGIACYLAKDKISAIRSRSRMNAMIEESNRIARQREIEEKHRAISAINKSVEQEKQ
ncbi:hypothetical protein DZA28_20795 [Pseudomonas alloputida]|uniref:Uncharacterized protein n=1 Tax=Pseudomonas alloputida TaxID=1940621 RepID=A0ABY3D998_9PSED|nr:hypothetical protein [Pseudomonas alloputida]TRZ62248.1 hypothetical protein DZA28_20795 [Pseudomonas alloputida]